MTAKKVLRCHLPFQHESPHAVLLPAEAGEDEGKVYYWPRENYENHASVTPTGTETKAT